MKIYPILSIWYKTFFNHLYFINERYPKDEDRKLALEYVRSFLHHCTGKHRWEKGDGFSLVTKCNHPVPAKGKKGKKVGEKPPKDLIKVDSPEWALLYEMLYKSSFAKNFIASSSDAGTAMCESFHSLSLMYSPKRFYCSPPYYNKKMKLSIQHQNSLVYGEMEGGRREIGNVVLPRKGRIALSVKRKMNSGEHPWRSEILDECWTLRDEYEGNRFLKRIGAPDDEHFDELKQIYDTMVQEEEEEEYLSDEI